MLTFAGAGIKRRSTPTLASLGTSGRSLMDGTPFYAISHTNYVSRDG